jgi:hypothetical protein
VVLPASHKTSRIPWYSGSADNVSACLPRRDSHPLWCALPGHFRSPYSRRRDARVRHLSGPTTPTQHRTRPVPLSGFGLFPFRSPLLRESRLFSLPPGTEMVQFPGFAHHTYSLQSGVPVHDDRGVAPFGYPRLTACLQLPEAFRSSPRPSSPQSA